MNKDQEIEYLREQNAILKKQAKDAHELFNHYFKLYLRATGQTAREVVDKWSSGEKLKQLFNSKKPKIYTMTIKQLRIFKMNKIQCRNVIDRSIKNANNIIAKRIYEKRIA